MSILPDLFAEAHFEQRYQARLKRLQAFQARLTPEVVGRTAQIAENWPQLPAPLVAAAGMTGMDPSSQIFADLSQRILAESQAREPMNEDEARALLSGVGGAVTERFPGPVTGIQGALRAAMTTWNVLWNEALARPFKTGLNLMGLTDQGPMGLAEAWNAAGADYGTEALRRFLRDPIGNLTPLPSRPDAEVNLGSGILPRSTPNAPGVGPGMAGWRGDDLTAIGYRQTHEGLTRGGRPISPGRFVTDYTGLRPDTGPYNFVSGLIDAGAQIALDPGAALLKTGSALRLAGRTFSDVPQVVTAAAHARLPQLRRMPRGAAGLVYRWGQKHLRSPDFDAWRVSLEGQDYLARGDRIIELARGGDPGALADLVDVFSRRHMGLPRQAFDRLMNGESFDSVLRSYAGLQLPNVPSPGRLSAAIGQRVAGDYGGMVGVGGALRRWGVDYFPGADRTFRQMSAQSLDITNLDTGFWQFNRFLHNAGINRESRAGYLARWAAVPELHKPEVLFNLAGDVIREMIGDVKAQWARQGLAPEQLDILGREIDELGTLFEDMENLRKYATDATKHPFFFPGTKLSIIPGKGATTEETAQLVSEFLAHNIPLPDARMVRNALSGTRQAAVAHLPKWAFESPLGNNIMQKVLDPLMTKLWKPLTLLRVAWPMRVLPEELLRMTTEGFDTLLTNPAAAMAWMVRGGKETEGVLVRVLEEAGIKPRGGGTVLDAVRGRGLPQMLDEIPLEDLRLALSREFDRVVRHRDADALLGFWRNGQYLDQWSSYKKNTTHYPLGMAHVTLQNANDPLMRRVATDGREAARRWLRSTEGLEYRRSMINDGRFPDGALSPNSEAFLSDEYLDLILQSYEARLHIHAGGVVRLQMNVGATARQTADTRAAAFARGGDPAAVLGEQWVDVDMTNVPQEFIDILGITEDVTKPSDWLEIIKGDQTRFTRVRYTVEKPGDPRVVEAIGRGRFYSESGSELSLLGDDVIATDDSVRAALELKFRTGEWAGVGPEFVKGPVVAKANPNAERAVAYLYRQLMGKPTNFLSRAPTFKQYYWRRIEDLLPYMDDLARANAYAAAANSELSEETLTRWRTKLDQLSGHSGPLKGYAQRIELKPSWDDGPRLTRGERSKQSLAYIDPVGSPESQLYGGVLYSTNLDVNAMSYVPKVEGGFGWDTEFLSRFGVTHYSYDDAGHALIFSTAPRARVVGDTLEMDRPRVFRSEYPVGQQGRLPKMVDATDTAPWDRASFGQSRRHAEARAKAEGLKFRLVDNPDFNPDGLLEALADGSTHLEWTSPRSPVMLDLEQDLPTQVLDAFQRAAARTRVDAPRNLAAEALGDRYFEVEALFGDDLLRNADTVRYWLGQAGVNPSEIDGLVDSFMASQLFESVDMAFLQGDLTGFTGLEALGIINDSLPKPQAAAFWDQFHQELQSLGYDGMTHIGGKNTGSPPHNVHIWVNTEHLKPRPYWGLQDVTDEALYLADDLAKGYAMEATQELLYDAGRRSNFMDMFRNLFPFGEAWVEILTTWTRLMRENPVVFRRAQQVVEGARGSGFFSTDPETGEEMFNYPGGGLVNKILFGGPTSDALRAQGILGPGMSPVDLKLRGRVAGLNLVGGSVLPGFGPVMQVAAGRVSAPGFDSMRRLIAPFGAAEDAGTVGQIFDTFLPAYFRRLSTVLLGGNADQRRILSNSAIDIFKALVLQGADVTTPENRDKVMQHAYRLAGQLTMIRGLATFVAPSSPEASFYVVPDAVRADIGDERADVMEERVWFFQSLGLEYRRIAEALDWDEAAAAAEFTARFGVDPSLFAVSKTQVVSPRSVQREGDQWTRRNAELFRLAPYTAYYANPDVEGEGEFDYAAYVRQIREGDRETLSLEQWESKRQDTVGRIAYENARTKLADAYGDRYPQHQAEALRIFRLYLRNKYPGYLQPNPGVAESASTEQRIRELAEVWPNHPTLADSDTGRAVARYLRARDAVVARASVMGITGWQTAQDTAQLREILRQFGEKLIREHPDFSYLFRLVLERELGDEPTTVGAP